MASLNKVLLMGNLTRDPEVRYTPSGNPVGDMSIAINRQFKGSDGQTKDETVFVDIVVWGRQAETCGEYLRKGSSVFIEGRLQLDEWEKDGQKHRKMKVVADRVQFLSTSRSNKDSSSNNSDAGASSVAQPVAPASGDVSDDEDLPF